MVNLSPLVDIVGRSHFFSGDEVDDRYKIDLLGRNANEPLCVVRPHSTDEVVQIVRFADAAGLAIVPAGGGTGFSGGTVADGAIKLSLEGLNRIHEIDPASMTMTVDAGVTLLAAQEAAEAIGLLLPLDLNSRGSAMIGGAIATNAGGNRVFRWGMMRDMVLGLEAVLADGSVVSSLGKMIKDNAGYDWKHLLIGSEGTLGIVTKAVLRLRPMPSSSQTAMVAVEDFSTAIQLLRRLEMDLAGRLSSFELMWNSFYEYVTTFNLPKRPRPMPAQYGLYCLIESLGSNPEEDSAAFEQSLARLLEDGVACDAVIAQSLRERDALWSVREDAGEAVLAMKGFAGFDISMAQTDIPRFKQRSEENIRAVFPQATLLYYGHIGDGNMHILAAANDDDPDSHHKLDVAVYSAAREVGASISGEHGIGLEKREFLSWTRSPAEIALMRRIKQALDPRNLLNPGKVL